MNNMTTKEPITIAALANHLNALKQGRFSGRLVLIHPLGHQWDLYFYMGRILYARGGVHPIKQWRRNLAAHCFRENLAQLNQMNLAQEIARLPAQAVNVCWDYYLLCLWGQQKKITREQIVNMIQSVVIEILFDVNQAVQINAQLRQENPLTPQLALIDPEQAYTEAHKLWVTWKTANLSDILPYQAPSIRQAELLQQKTSPAVYKSLTVLLDGQRSLREIAMQTNRNFIDVTRSLLPYIEAGLVELNTISDLPSPVSPPEEKTPTKPKPNEQAPLIACVDDSPLVCQTLEKILTAVGYRFLGIQDSMRAIAILLTKKPDLIFLDLVMPHTNGYEICSQLRKVSAFRDTPIVILTGNDGIIDRVKAKVVGASDFLGKPVDAETVIGVASKYLKKDSSLVVH
jgi:two-component system, chemotaxis family, response regulator PixG